MYEREVSCQNGANTNTRKKWVSLTYIRLETATCSPAIDSATVEFWINSSWEPFRSLVTFYNVHDLPLKCSSCSLKLRKHLQEREYIEFFLLLKPHNVNLCN